jgi:hypothetical protein
VHQAALGMHRKVAYIRPKVIGPFPRPCACSSVHRAALLIKHIDSPLGINGDRPLLKQNVDILGFLDDK